MRQLEPDATGSTGHQDDVAGADLDGLAGCGRHQIRLVSRSACPAHLGGGVARAQLGEQRARHGRSSVPDAQLDALDQLVGALARQGLHVAGKGGVDLVGPGDGDHERAAGGGLGLRAREPMRFQHRLEPWLDLRLPTAQRREMDHAADVLQRVSRLTDDCVVPIVVEERGERVRDAERIAREQQALGQRVLRRRRAEIRLDERGGEWKQLAPFARHLAEDGRKHRSDGRMRLRDGPRHVLDDVLYAGLRPEQVPRQSAGARERLVHVAVQLDGHQRVEAEIAGERLRGLDGLQRKRADAGDGREDRLRHPLLGRG